MGNILIPLARSGSASIQVIESIFEPWIKHRYSTHQAWPDDELLELVRKESIENLLILVLTHYTFTQQQLQRASSTPFIWDAMELELEDLKNLPLADTIINLVPVTGIAVGVVKGSYKIYTEISNTPSGKRTIDWYVRLAVDVAMVSWSLKGLMEHKVARSVTVLVFEEATTLAGWLVGLFRF